MTRARRLTLVGALGLCALLLAAALYARQHLEATLLHLAQAHSGRQIRIEGPFAARVLTSEPYISAEQLHIGNPPWMAPGDTALVGKLNLQLQWQWSWPFLVLRRLEIRQATLQLLRDPQGRANWHMHAEGPGAGPPLIRSLSMPQAHVVLHDERRHLEFDGTVTAGDVSGGGTPPPLRIAAQGRLNGRVASLVIDGEPLALARRGQPYHFTLLERSGGDELQGRGLLPEPFDFRELQGSFKASGPTLHDAFYMVGLRLIDTAPFQLAGEMQRHGKKYRYRLLQVSAGGSDLRGELRIDSTGSRPRVEGELDSRQLRLADLGAHAAGRPAAAEPTAGTGSLPDTPLRLAALQRVDWALRFGVQQFDAGREQLQQLSGRLAIRDGVLMLKDVSAALAEGQLTGTGTLDASGPVPRVGLQLSVSQLQLAKLRPQESEPPVTGLLSARAELQASGRSLHELAASTRGTLSAVVPRGTMRSTLVEAADLDFVAALGALAHSDKQTEVRCAALSLEGEHGLFHTRTLVIDTEKSLITGAGTVQLDPSALDLTLNGRAKHPGLRLHSSVLIQGPPAHPQLRLSAGNLAAQSAAAAALGVVLTPLAAVLAFVSPGLAHDTDCAAVLAQAGGHPGASH
jgi:AsmA family protein